MKVLVLSRMFPNAKDPANGIFVLEQIRQLRRLGAEISVIAPTPWLPPLARHLPRFQKYLAIPSHEIVDGFAVWRPRVLALPKSRLFSAYGIMTYLRCRKWVGELMRQSRIDVIHAHALLPDGHAASLLGREFGIPVVCTVHGSDVSDYPFRSKAALWATRSAVRGSDWLIAVNADLNSRIRSLGANCPSTVVYNGADERVFSPVHHLDARRELGIPSARKVVVFAGYLCREKGLDALLRAMKLIRRPDVVLYLVGDGDLKDSLQQESVRLGITERCHFVGKRAHSEMPIWLSAADCLVLPSITEGFPLVIVEAMFCHTPVIATRVGGVPEIVRDGETGLLVSPGDSSAIATAIERMLFDGRCAKHMSERAASEARMRYTWAANAEQTCSAYDQVVRRVFGERSKRVLHLVA